MKEKWIQDKRKEGVREKCICYLRTVKFHKIFRFSVSFILKMLTGKKSGFIRGGYSFLFLYALVNTIVANMNTVKVNIAFIVKGETR